MRSCLRLFLNGGKRSIVGRFGDDHVQALLGGADLLFDGTVLESAVHELSG